MRQKENNRKKAFRIAGLLVLILAAGLMLGIFGLASEKPAAPEETAAYVRRDIPAVAAVSAVPPAESETAETSGTDEATEPETEETVISAAEPEEEIMTDPADVAALAKVVWGEARYLTKLEQSAVVWCVLNRVDSPERYFPDTIVGVATQKNQFAYRADAEPDEEVTALCEDVLRRYYREKRGDTDVGRTLPAEYCYFWGDGKKNYFRTELHSYNYWDWSLPDPYGE